MTSTIRIIAGQWRGRRIPVPDRPGLRPTGDRARETLFNWLAPCVPDARCLDLYAGSGALGLEAASRGAGRVVMIERDRKAHAALRRILEDWPGGDVLELVQADALRWLQTAAGPFDLVFVDPPFDSQLHEHTLALLARPGLLSPDARVYVESHARHSSPVGDSDPHWRVLRDKRLGEVRMQLIEPIRAC